MTKNNKYAVIRIKGNQYKVNEGQEFLVDKLTEKKIAPEVLLVSMGNKVTIGQSLVKDVVVKLKVIKEKELGKKLYVQKFKAKSRYRRKYGFRPQYTRLLVEKIG